MEIPISFKSPQQEELFNVTHRYQCGSGGYGSGKTYLFCLKLLFLLVSLPGYRIAIVRKELKVLRKTTMATFFKLLPGKVFDQVVHRHSEMDGETEFKNGSTILWLGLDRFAEQDVKSLELNAAFLDQAEEIDELIYNHLDARLGRWDQVDIPESMLTENWPRNEGTGKPLAPTYMFVACNPDTESHWIWREFHPNSLKWQEENKKTHFFINMPSTSNTALSKENLETMLRKDPTWVRRYVLGEWGFSEAQIHKIPPESIIQPTHEFLENFKKKALLYRTYDHGESSPSSCLWHAIYKGIHLVYREYYAPNKLISDHRRAIADLSGDERYSGNYADPQIFKKLQQRQGGRYCTADEYLDTRITSAPTIAWSPADNNEMGTRNRINEMLMLHKGIQHPITGADPAPKLYFCRRDPVHNPQGCWNVINETQAARRIKEGEVNGKPIWTEDRDKKVADHAYDALRYGIALHSHGDFSERKPPDSPNSFNSYWRKTAAKNYGSGRDLSYGIGIRY